jgi:hypothetical protein
LISRNVAISSSNCSICFVFATPIEPKAHFERDQQRTRRATCKRRLADLFLTRNDDPRADLRVPV